MCGTPIGLPGPPSVPLGVPAGLQKHVIVNHTRVHLPETDREGADRREADAGLQLSEAGRPRPHRRTHRVRASAGSSSRWATAASASHARKAACVRCPEEHCPCGIAAECVNDSERPTAHVQQWASNAATCLSNPHHQRLVTMVRSIRCLATEATCCGRRVAGRMAMLVLWWLGVAATLPAQQPPRALLPSWCNATGSDWQPATPAGRTIARVLPAG